MEQSDHVLLCGHGAEAFANTLGLETAPPDYFITQEKKEEWEKKKAQSEAKKPKRSRAFGTVGAVALDSHGNLAAATSTGGLTNKQFSRVGDTPIIGGGTYARNGICAVSCTGDGEFIMRAVAAHEVACLIEYKGLSLTEACHLVIFDKLQAIGGEGGLIAVNHLGQVALPYNSPSMYRAHVSNEQEASIAIFEA